MGFINVDPVNTEFFKGDDIVNFVISQLLKTGFVVFLCLFKLFYTVSLPIVKITFVHILQSILNLTYIFSDILFSTFIR